MNGTPPPLTANEVAARLDRLPISRFHYRFLALISLGAWFDYYDNFVAGTLAVALPRAGVLPTTRPGEWFSAVGLFTATLPLGMFFGSLFLGMASDHLGRRLALHQSHDDLASESTHGDARPNAFVAKDLPLALGKPLPSLHHLGTNRHEEFLSLACWKHDVSGWNYSFT